MTVATEVRSVQYDGDGVTDTFPIPFEVLDASHVKVTFYDGLGIVAPTVLVQGVNPYGYNVVTGNAEINDVFPISASTPMGNDGSYIIVERVVPITQGIDFSNLSSFDPETHEEMADLGVMVDQQLFDRIKALESAGAPGSVIAGNGLEFQLDLVTLYVKPDGDGSIEAPLGGVRVGTLATDLQHGTRGGGTQHAVAVSGGAAGFMTGTDKQRADSLWTRTLTAGQGLTGGGDLSANRTIDVVAADASIVVGANSVGVGVLQSDAMHGLRGGGTQHADVVAGGASGFMTGADKTKLDSLVTENTLEGSVVTSDATVTSVLQWTPDDNTTEHLEVTVVARRKSGSGSDGDSAAYVKHVTIKRNGATSIVAAVVTSVHAAEDVAGWDSDVSVAASPIVVVRVTGAGGTIINWSCRVRRLIASET